MLTNDDRGLWTSQKAQPPDRRDQFRGQPIWNGHTESGFSLFLNVSLKSNSDPFAY